MQCASDGMIKLHNVTEIYLLGKESRGSAVIDVSLEIQRGEVFIDGTSLWSLSDHQQSLLHYQQFLARIKTRTQHTGGQVSSGTNALKMAEGQILNGKVVD